MTKDNIALFYNIFPHIYTHTLSSNIEKRNLNSVTADLSIKFNND